MTEADIAGRINNILVREFEIDPGLIRPEAHLYEDLELDSLDAVDLVAALEREFGIRIDRQQHEQEIRAIRTLAEVYDFASRLARSATN